MIVFTFPIDFTNINIFIASVGTKGLVGDNGPQGRQGLDGNKGMDKSFFLLFEKIGPNNFPFYTQVNEEILNMVTWVLLVYLGEMAHRHHTEKKVQKEILGGLDRWA